jgi:hypothetical protein
MLCPILIPFIKLNPVPFILLVLRGGFFKNELRYDYTHGVAKSDLGRNSKSVVF